MLRTAIDECLIDPVEAFPQQCESNEYKHMHDVLSVCIFRTMEEKRETLVPRIGQCRKNNTASYAKG